MILVRRGGALPSAFRSRRSTDRSEFYQVEQLWHPKPEHAQQGRLNGRGRPLFYCSDNSSVSIFEQRPQNGDLITVLECSSTGVAGTYLLIGELSRRINDNEVLLPQAPSIDADKLLQRYGIEKVQYSATLDRIFSRWLSQPDKGYYVLTNWLSGFLFAMEDLDGIVYPTVVWNEGFNIALKPASSAKLLRPDRAFAVAIDNPSANKKGQSPGYLLMVSESIGSDGCIVWKMDQQRDARSVSADKNSARRK
jgi:hypothetical protein